MIASGHFKVAAYYRGGQYVAVVVSYGESAPSVFTVLTPEIPLPIARNSSIWVFALPEGTASQPTPDNRKN
jgi:hypothetical protein